MRANAFVVMALAAWVLGCGREPPAETSIVAEIFDPDSSRSAWLEVEGMRYDESNVTVWMPPGIDTSWARALADTLNRGVIAVEQLVGAPVEWATLGQKRVLYYLSPDSFVSHVGLSHRGELASFLSWWRVDSGLAPYKHEALHLILDPDTLRRPPDFDGFPTMEQRAESAAQWLIEGFPDYVAEVAAEQHGLHEGDVWAAGGTDRVDGVCRERLTSEWGSVVLPYIPGRGYLPQLMTTARPQVAAVFYPCVMSFVKYLVEQQGLDAVLSLMPALDPLALLERTSGKSAADWRAGWLGAIGYRGDGGA